REGAGKARRGAGATRRLLGGGGRRGRRARPDPRRRPAGPRASGRVCAPQPADPQAAGAGGGARGPPCRDHRAGRAQGEGRRRAGFEDGEAAQGGVDESPEGCLQVMAQAQKITPRAKDFSEWYNDVIMQAELADYSPVRGCMVIRPHGYRIWELMQGALDDMFRATGHQNAYFPLFIHQWCNIVRWEFRTRLFLRTTEFLWQEGHTAHATEAEAEAEARQMLGVYRKFQEDWMAMPVITGRKTESEKFAGAQRTYALEALMQDHKALQAGTSHNLGQNFAKAFGVQYQTASGGLEHAWSTSWGVSTRMIGGLIMTHSDDNGLVCPPKLAPVQGAIVQIGRAQEERGQVSGVGGQVKAELAQAGIRVELDLRDNMKPGAKYFEWEAKGVPLRLEIGPRDVAAGPARGARPTGGKAPPPPDGLARTVAAALDEIQAGLFKAAKDRREAHSIRGVTKQQFIEFMKQPGGFAYGGFCGSAACEAEIKQQTAATVRILPDSEFRSPEAPKTCMWCGKPSVAEAVWAQAY